jgi:hypothetical protein
MNNKSPTFRCDNCGEDYPILELHRHCYYDLCPACSLEQEELEEEEQKEEEERLRIYS